MRKVLIAGGEEGGFTTGGINDTAELFDPASGTFTLVSNNMTFTRVIIT